MLRAAAPPEPAAATASPAATAAARRGKHAKPGPAHANEPEALAGKPWPSRGEESGSPLGRLSSLTDATGKKAGLMVGDAAALTLLAFALMALVGVFL